VRISVWEERFDSSGSLQMWRNSVLPEVLDTVQVGLLSHDTLNGRMRVELFLSALNDPEEAPVLQGMALKRYSGLKAGKEYEVRFRIETDSVDELQVLLFRDSVLRRGVPVAASAESIDSGDWDDTIVVRFTAVDSEMVLLIGGTREDTSGGYHYYIDDYSIREGWVQTVSCDPGNLQYADGGYRFGFNGMEMDDEIYGFGGSYTTEFRQNDPRLGGRWWSRDLIVKPWESPYAGYSNNPIYFADPYGLDPCKNCSEEAKDLQNRTESGEVKEGETWEDKSGNKLIYSDGIWVPNISSGEEDGSSKSQDPQYQTKQGIQNAESLSTASTITGSIGLLNDIFKETTYKGPYIYKNSKGVIQSVFETQYGRKMMQKHGEAKNIFGKGKGIPKQLGNIKNYSRNARTAIKLTNSVRVVSNTLIVAGVVLDGAQVINAYATDDPKKQLVLIKSSANTIVAAYGVLVPGVGWVISGAYFVIDATIGWDKALESMESIDSEHYRITGKHFMQGPKY